MQSVMHASSAVLVQTHVRQVQFPRVTASTSSTQIHVSTAALAQIHVPSVRLSRHNRTVKQKAIAVPDSGAALLFSVAMAKTAARLRRFLRKVKKIR